MTLGPRRAARVEAYLKALGVVDPLRFSRTWCRMRYGNLAEMTVPEGKTLMAEAERSIRIIGTPEQQAHLKEIETKQAA